ncbi:MAG: CHAD domain-containing protein [Candidatus Binataceae bacterium]
MTKRSHSRAKISAPPRPAKPRWTKAIAVTLSPASGLHKMMVAIIGGCCDHWLANVPAAIDGRDPEGIHQARVGLRRLRSALSLFKKQIPTAQRSALNAEAKWLFGQLGLVRDLDVFIGSLGEKDEAMAAVARKLRGRAHRKAVTALQSPRARRLAQRLDVWLQGRGWRDNAEAAASPASIARAALNRRLRRIRDAAEEIGELAVDARHELRIAVKKARYGLEFLSAVLPEKRAQRWTSSLKRLQDSLGHLNDVDVAERTVATLVRGAGNQKSRVARAGQAFVRRQKKALAAAEPQLIKDCAKLAVLPLL